MEQLVKDYEKVLKKQKQVSENNFHNLDIIIKFISETRDILNTSGSIELQPTLASLQQNVNATAEKIQEEQKDLYGALNKFGKAIDKKFKTDLSTLTNSDTFAKKNFVLDKTIALHFLRRGQFHLADIFIRESQLPLDSLPSHLRADFAEMYSLLSSLEERQTAQALEWCRIHHEELAQRRSPLEFQLHKLSFTTLLTAPLQAGGGHAAALAYAKRHFPSFMHSHMREIERLMTSILFLTRGLESSPYVDLFSPTQWTDILDLFTAEFCTHLEQPPIPPLFLTTMVGMTALPILAKVSLIMKTKRTEWSAQDELPVEIPLPPSQRFHSVFSCPVSKDQATEENPPMMMPCGHVIAKESLMKLSKGRNSGRFKCPYCPSESSSNQAIKVMF